MKKSRERGQGLVEFAVIFPLLVFFLFAVFDVGLAMNRRATLQHAVREGARYAALSDNSPAAFDVVCSRTIAQSQDLLDDAHVSLSYADVDSSGAVGPGDAVDVKATYTYKPFMLRSVLGFFGSTIADINMDVTGSSRLELPLTSPMSPGVTETCS
jgi:hypothetical protein